MRVALPGKCAYSNCYELLRTATNWIRSFPGLTPVATWTPVEGDLAAILTAYPKPLEALATGDVPAFIMRRAYDPGHGEALVNRFYELGLLYDPRTGVGGAQVPRIDIGTSLGRYRADMEAFFAHAEHTHSLFESLFDSYDDPVAFV